MYRANIRKSEGIGWQPHLLARVSVPNYGEAGGRQR
jgi:hypothetical protein